MLSYVQEGLHIPAVWQIYITDSITHEDQMVWMDAKNGDILAVTKPGIFPKLQSQTPVTTP